MSCAPLSSRGTVRSVSRARPVMRSAVRLRIHTVRLSGQKNHPFLGGFVHQNKKAASFYFITKFTRRNESPTNVLWFEFRFQCPKTVRCNYLFTKFSLSSSVARRASLLSMRWCSFIYRVVSRSCNFTLTLTNKQA